MASFPPGKEEDLISAVKDRPALYDKGNKMYSNREFVSQLWSEVGALIDCEGAVCKARWQSLRDYFTRKNKEMTKSEETASKKRKWHLFDHLSFLAPYFVPKETNGSFDSFQEEDASLLSLEEMERMDDVIPPVTFEEPPAELIHVPEVPKLPSSRSVAEKRKKATLDEIDEVVLKMLKVPMSDHEYFFKSLTPMLSKLNDIETLEFRSEVQNLVIKFLKRHQCEHKQ